MIKLMVAYDNSCADAPPKAPSSPSFFARRVPGDPRGTPFLFGLTERMEPQRSKILLVRNLEILEC